MPHIVRGGVVHAPNQGVRVVRLNPASPIGLFDSGVGGATVLGEIARQLPSEDLIYLADQAHCPYGPRPPAQIQALAVAATRWLVDQGAKLVVVACHSASAAALEDLRSAFPAIPFVGMVPAVKPAARTTRSGVVGVLATPATIAGGLLHEVVERWATGVTVLAQPCDGLADLVEAGALDQPATRVLLQRYLDPLLAAGADTIVLGCTHYPWLAPQIRAITGPQVTLIDPSPAIARQVARLLHQHAARHPRSSGAQIRYATTGDPAPFVGLLGQLGLQAGAVEYVDLAVILGDQ